MLKIGGTCANLLNQREKNLCHGAETVLLAALKHVCGAAQSCYFVDQALFATFSQHDLQHLTDRGLASKRFLQFCAGRPRKWHKDFTTDQREIKYIF